MSISVCSFPQQWLWYLGGSSISVCLALRYLSCPPALPHQQSKLTLSILSYPCCLSDLAAPVHPYISLSHSSFCSWSSSSLPLPAPQLLSHFSVAHVIFQHPEHPCNDCLLNTLFWSLPSVDAGEKSGLPRVIVTAGDRLRNWEQESVRGESRDEVWE